MTNIVKGWKPVSPSKGSSESKNELKQESKLPKDTTYHISSLFKYITFTILALYAQYTVYALNSIYALCALYSLNATYHIVSLG